MAMATLPGVVAGGRTICTRSPDGKDAERSGEAASIRCCVKFASSFAKRTHQSKSANGSDRRIQPSRVSTKPSCGALMQTSVTSGLVSKGRSARSVKSSAEVSWSAGNGSQLIYRPEIQIASDQDLNAVA